jgi:hypothetical protein
MSQIGWVTVKVILRTALLIFHNNYEYIIRSLCLNKMLNLPNTLDCASIHTSRMDFYSKEALPQLNLSSSVKFYNLNSLRFNNTTFNNNEISILSKFSLLEFISLKAKCPNGYLPNIFKEHQSPGNLVVILKFF